MSIMKGPGLKSRRWRRLLLSDKQPQGRWLYLKTCHGHSCFPCFAVLYTILLCSMLSCYVLCLSISLAILFVVWPYASS